MLGQDEKLKMLLEFLKGICKTWVMTDISPFPHRSSSPRLCGVSLNQHMKMCIYQINQAGTDFPEILSFIKRLTEWLFIKLHSPQDINVVSPQSSFNFWCRGVSEMLGEIWSTRVYNLRGNYLCLLLERGVKWVIPQLEDVGLQKAR